MDRAKLRPVSPLGRLIIWCSFKVRYIFFILEY